MANPIPAAPAVDPKSTAANIVKGVQDKANGSAPAVDPKAPAPVVVDPNAGKEKYVVDGKEIWLSPEVARAYVQKGIAFEPKVSQLGLLQRETAEFLNKLKTDPLAILMDQRIGHSPEKVLEKIFSSNQISDAMKEMTGKWYWDNVAKLERMTPEQRRAYELEKENKEFKDRDASARDQAIKLENQRRAEARLNQVKAVVAEAMKESGLPSNDTPLGAFMAYRVTQYLDNARRQQVSITPKDAIERVKGELKLVQSSYYDNLDDETFIKEIGEKNAERVKKHFLKLVKEAEKKIPENKSPSTFKKGERKTMSSDEFREYLDGIKRNGK